MARPGRGRLLALLNRIAGGLTPAPPVAGQMIITDDGLPAFDPAEPVSTRNFPEQRTVRGGVRYGGRR